MVFFFLDANFHWFDVLRSRVLLVISPIQCMVKWPAELIDNFSLIFINKKSLVAENLRLNNELQLTRIKLQRLDFLAYENAQLRSLIKLSQQVKNKYLSTQILIRSFDGFGQQIMLNRGKKDGVYVGQPVLDAYGLFGQVIIVSNKTSKIMLVTDRKSAIPVMVIRNGLQTIAVGVGSGDYLELLNVPETADIKVGDILVTSGLDNLFPAGYQVGVIKEIKHESGSRFMKVVITPQAHINSSRHLVLVWTDLVEKSKVDKKNET